MLSMDFFTALIECVERGGGGGWGGSSISLIVYDVSENRIFNSSTSYM